MSLAVRANVRVAAASRDPEAALAGFPPRHPHRRHRRRMATVGLGLLGSALVVLFFKADAPTMLEGFGSGAALVARCSCASARHLHQGRGRRRRPRRQGRAGIPEDDPRNAATIADNVGDNVATAPAWPPTCSSRTP